MAKSTSTRARRARTTADAPRPIGEGAWGRLPARVQHAAALLLLLAVSLAFFAGLHFSGRTLIGGDTVQWRAMAESVIAAEAAGGEQVLWATNAFGGMPTYTIYNSGQVPGVDRFLAWLRGFLWPTSHFFFGLAGAYLLVWYLTRQSLPAVLSAVAFGLTTYMPVILVAGHNTKFIALLYAPWLLLAFAFALERPRLLSGLLFAAALALNLRAGHVQITYYVAWTMAIWWIVELVGAVRGGRLPAFGRATGWLALGSLLGVLMVAQPYLVLAEYKAFTQRGAAAGGVAGAGGMDWSYAMAWSQGWGELVTLAIADAYGGSALYWGPKTFTSGPHYVGGVVLLLAALALAGLRRNVVYALGAAALVMTLFSLGENFEALNRLMYAYFPLFDSFRVPETWLSVVALALAVLAGLGAAYAGRTEAAPEAEAAKTRRTYVVAGAALAVVALLLVARGAFFDFTRGDDAARVTQAVLQQNPGVSPSDPQVQAFVRTQVAGFAEQREELFVSDALRTLVFLALAGLLLVLHRRRTIPAWALQGGLALLVLVDLWGVDRRYFSDEHLADAPSAEAAVTGYDFDRYIVDRQAEAGGLGHFRSVSLEANPFQNARPSFYYESLGGYSATKLRLVQDYIDHVFYDPETNLPNENALDLLNTRYVIAPRPLPGLDVAFRSETGFLVLENPDALPRAFFVGDTEVVADAEATWRRLRDPSFDPARTAILAAPIEGFETTPVTDASTAEATLVSYAPDRIVYDVETDADRLLVLSEVYYPAGWRATLDGEPVPIVRADYLLRAVPVPAGAYRLELAFEPVTYNAGHAVAQGTSLLVYGGLLALLGLAIVRRRRGARDEAAPAAQE